MNRYIGKIVQPTVKRTSSFIIKTKDLPPKECTYGSLADCGYPVYAPKDIMII